MTSLRFLGAVRIRAGPDSGSIDLVASPEELATLSFLAAARPWGFWSPAAVLDVFQPPTGPGERSEWLDRIVASLRARPVSTALAVLEDGRIGMVEEDCSIDVREFDRALHEADFEAALNHYGGDFLQDFVCPSLPAFERWADGVRTRLRKDATQAAVRLIERHESRNDLRSAVAWARRATEISPVDEIEVRRLLELLHRQGDVESVEREFDLFAIRLAGILGTEPSDSLRHYVKELRSGAERRSTARGGATVFSGADTLSDAKAAESEMADVQQRLTRALRGRYSIDRRIGRGGMAIVFLAQDLRHERPVAIKVLRPDLTKGLGIQRFLNEIRIEASLEHPNIVPIYDSGEAEGLPYYVMRYFEGESLRDRLKREGQLPIADALLITSDVASALQEAHSRGVIHRDIKPANILLRKGRAVVTDFGIARALTEAGAVRLTITGASMGTPGYMSPEQATAASRLDSRTDQYSLACVLHEMLAGEGVFPGTSARSILARHVSLPPPPVSKLRPSVPVEIERAILRALEKPPVDRFATIEEFVAALTTPTRRPVLRILSDAIRRRPLRALAATLAALLLATLAIAQLTPEPVAWANGVPGSLTVLPFYESSSDADEQAAVLGISEQIARELNWWDGVRAIGRTSLSGIVHDLGFDGDAFQSIDAALRVARAAETDGLVAVAVRLRADSVMIDASLYDVRSSRLIDRPLTARGPRDRVDELVAKIVYGALGVDDAIATRAGLRPGSNNRDAIIADWQGLAHLAAARLAEAESSFRHAIQLDSAYSLALTHLALTLYWEAMDGAKSIDEVVPEIPQRSTAAVSHMGALTLRDSTYVRAFYQFQLGNYAEARRLYGALLDAEPTDLHGWLMIGETESRDRWLTIGSDGTAAPRGSLNRALEAFERTITLRPDFELGYWRFSEVYHEVENALELQACKVFRVAGPMTPPWQTPSHEEGEAFCPVAGDSVAWVSREAFDTMPVGVLEAGADDLYDRSVRMLERWADFAPTAPRPREALSELITSRRTRERIAAPERLEEWAGQALGHALEGLALEADTMPADWFRMANLYLAAGRLSEAAHAARVGLSAIQKPDGTWAVRPPLSAINVFLAIGRPATALAIMAESYVNTRFIMDTVTGRPLAYGGAEPTVTRLKLLGSANVQGPTVTAELDRLTRRWRTLGYSARQQILLSNDATQRIAVALALDPANLARWAGHVDLRHPLWLALVEANGDGPDARQHFLEALKAEAPSMTEAEHAFTLAAIASRLGDPEHAIQLYSRLDSLPHRLGTFDIGWGLQPLSRLLRAEEMERTGDLDGARAQLRAFLVAWNGADSLAAPQVERARTLLARLNSTTASAAASTSRQP